MAFLDFKSKTKAIADATEEFEFDNFNVGYLYGLFDRTVGWIGFNVLQNDAYAQRHFKSVCKTLDDDIVNDMWLFRICPVDQIAALSNITPDIFEEGDTDESDN